MLRLSPERDMLVKEPRRRSSVLSWLKSAVSMVIQRPEVDWGITVGVNVKWSDDMFSK